MSSCSSSYAMRSALCLDPLFAAFPTYPVVLALKGTIMRPCLQTRSQSSRLTSTGTDQDVVNFTERLRESNTIKGIPKFDPRRLVHASQSIEILKPLPLVSGPGWKLKKRLTSIRENSSCHSPCISSLQRINQSTLESGVIIEVESLLTDPYDTPYARLFVRTHPILRLVRFCD